MSQRLERVSELIRAEVSAVLLRGLKDPRVSGLVTVTDVWISGDLGEARVYVSVFGDEREQQRTLAGLQSARVYVRREVTRAIKLRTSPSIDFYLDEGIARGTAVIAKMRELGLNVDEKPRAPTEFEDEFPADPTTVDPPEPPSEPFEDPTTPTEPSFPAVVDALAVTDPALTVAQNPLAESTPREGDAKKESR